MVALVHRSRRCWLEISSLRLRPVGDTPEDTHVAMPSSIDREHNSIMLSREREREEDEDEDEEVTAERQRAGAWFVASRHSDDSC